MIALNISHHNCVIFFLVIFFNLLFNFYFYLVFCSWVPAANQVPGRHDSHSQLGNGSWSMDLPQGILKQSSSGLTPHESSPKNAVSSGSTPTEIGNGSDVGSDNMTSVSATGIGSRSSLVKKKVVHSLPKNNTVLRYDPSTGLTEAVIVGSEDEDEKRDAPNGDSG